MDLTVAVICLALNIYHESRGEFTEGQLAVAQVVLTRAKKKQQTICEVVLDPAQFSWTTYDQGVWWMGDKPYLAVSHRPKNTPGNEFAWSAALKVARRALSREKIDVVGDATFYHVCTTTPYWAKHVEFVKVVGAHCFYRGDGRVRPVLEAAREPSYVIPAGHPRGWVEMALDEGA